MGKIFDGISKEFEDRANSSLKNINVGSLFNDFSSPIRSEPSVDPDPENIWSKTNTSYSGSDCTVIIQANNDIIVVGNLTTFSHSIHRDKMPIRTLGRTSVKGYVASGRSIAGSMVFTVFDTHPLLPVIKQFKNIRNPEDRYTSPLPDQLPPLDLILIFHNEYGYSSVVKLYGVEFSDDGTTYSINDIYSEAIMQYVARDMDIMVSKSEMKEFKDLLFDRQIKGGFIDNHLASLLSYRKRIISELEEINSYITAIDLETGRRAVGGAFIIGGSMIAGGAAGGALGSLIGASAGTAAVLPNLIGKGTISRAELNNLKDSYFKKKTSLLSELENINTEIRHYEQNIKGWNAQNASGGSAGVDFRSKDGGTAQFDSLRQGAPASSAPPGTTRG